MADEICEKCGQDHEGLCTAHHRRRDTSEPLTPCRNYRALGTAVCRMHGAKSPRGAAAGSFKTGRFSDVLPKGWAARADEMAADPDLLELRDHIALTDELLRQELRKLGDPESPEIGLKAALAAIRKIDKATVSHHGERAREAYSELKAAIQQVEAEQRSRGELHRLLEVRRRLVDTEHKRIERMKAFVTAEQLTVMAYAYVDMSTQMMERFAEQTATLVAQRAGQVRELLVGQLVGLGLDVSGGTVDRLLQRAFGRLELRQDVDDAGMRALADLAARIQTLGEDAGGNDVEADEVAN